jgi:hypothetical protein
MKVKIIDLAQKYKLNPDQLAAFAVENHEKYQVYFYQDDILGADTSPFMAEKLVKDFKAANRKGHDWREKIHEMMKNLNEDVAITDPQMAQQYSNGQVQLTNMDKQINALQSQVNKLNQNKIQIQKKMDELAQQSAQKTEEEKPPEQVQDETAVTAAATAAVAAAQAQPTSESLLIRVDESQDEEERINLEIDQISDQIMLLEDPAEIAEMEDRINSLLDQLKDLDMDQMRHESEYDLDQDLDLGEYPIDESYDDEEPRFTGMHGFPYEVNKEGRPIRKIDPAKSPKQRKQQAWSDTKQDKYDQFDKDISELEYEIKDLEEDREYQLDRFQSPKFEGVEGEMEEFFAQMGFEAADIVNSGGSDKDKLSALKKLGIANPKGIMDNYYYYYPEFNPELKKPKKEAQQEIKKIKDKIDKLHVKISKKEEQQQKMGSPVYDSYNPMSAENFYNLSETYAEIEDEKKNDDEDLDKEFLFYVKIIDEGSEFIGKIYKTRPDGDWYGKIKQGDGGNFERISYPTEYDEVDIVKFLGEEYDKIEMIDQHEFNDYIEGEDLEEEIINGSAWPTNTI